MEFLLDMLNGAIGALLGFLLALYLDRRKEKQAKLEKVNLVLASISDELGYIRRKLQEQYIDKNQPYTRTISTPAWDAVLSTAIILEVIEEESYAPIIDTYSSIKILNEDRRTLSDSEKLDDMGRIVTESEKAISAISKYKKGGKRSCHE